MKLDRFALRSQNGELFKRYNLTRAEAAIVDLIMSGLSTNRILEETGLGISGYKFHKCNIYKKLNIERKSTQAIINQLITEYKFNVTYVQMVSKVLPVGATE